ncbi:MAG: MATE family efflux transporter [Deltaproteobacteria bacterium]|nr:MATE family efflux transporter [Deltaproteobacteria bacterium]
MVDTAFVGRLGTTALASLGVNAGIFGLAFFVFNFLANGTTPLVARAVGENQRSQAGRIVVAGLGLAVVLGALGTGALLLFADPSAALMGAEEAELRRETLAYLTARAWAAPAVLLITAANGAYRGYLDTKTPLWVALGLNAINLILDPIFIFGLGWGVAGAAWATVAAQWAGAIAFLALLYGRDRERFAIPVALPQAAEVKHLLRVGSVLSIRTLALVFTLTAATAVATRLGEEVVAAHQVAWQLWLMFALFVDAFAYTAQSLVADHEGAGRPDEARAVADRLLQWGLGIGVLLGLGVWLAAPLWPVFFDLEPAVAALFATVLPIVAVMQPLNALVFVGDGIFMGARRFGWLAGAMLFATVPTLVGLWWVLEQELDLRVLWWCLVMLIGLRGLSLAVVYFGPKTILPRDPVPPSPTE